MGSEFWIIIPSRNLGQGKSRLSPLLDARARRLLSRAWLRHVVSVARETAGAARTLVVSRSGEVLGLARRMGVQALPERSHGLNPAVQQAVRHAVQHGAQAVGVLHADLPELRAGDVACLLRALSRPGVVLAPDRDRSGTNALALRPPGRFRFRFGANSFERHCAEARCRRMRIRVIERRGLARDVDTPQHYEALVRT